MPSCSCTTIARLTIYAALMPETALDLTYGFGTALLILMRLAASLECRNVRPVSYAIAMIALIVTVGRAMADEAGGCNSPDPERRIAGCTALIDAPGTLPGERANAYYLRGLAYSRLGQHQRSIPDFDAAIRIVPSSALALNSRANAWLKLGQPSQGVADIELALALEPRDPIVNATRGEIGQALGDRELAMRHHEAAMRFGGATFVRFYQCSLKLARLYSGPIDGAIRPEFTAALRQCVDQGSQCAPLPPFPIQECPEPVA
jgi:tetratricopeptide (TPR) repeat protein